ncbi:MAG: peptide chain release factor N(5)-glutamine methyltransferase [Chloroflexota bacterium]|nr:MAG: peptide chain release factor N(5)-glutamine methyltransferase [Chloroflexota bacterium]
MLTLTIKQALTQASSRLSTLSSPTLEARLLLSHVLNKPQTYLITNEKEELDAEKLSNFLAQVEKRKRRVPLAYLTQKKEFWGLDFYIDEHVFIPRSETEQLVEESLQIINDQMANAKSAAFSVADIGTGSGCIAISIAHGLLMPARKRARLLKIPQSLALGNRRLRCKIFATDISSKALKIAKFNARQILGPSHPITFLQGDLLKPLPQKVDLIVANLPYLSEKEYQEAEPEIRFEPKKAIIGGVHGNELIKKLLEQASSYLKPKGKVVYETVNGKILSWPQNAFAD